jgi:hydrogenase expression/formation protein HypE
MQDSVIQLGHGGGGRLARELIRDEILPRFGNGPLSGLPDGATLPAIPAELVFTTDSFVVRPLEFPGGNIGCLSVHGTVNDLAVCGAAPRWLSLGLIIEEGLPVALLRRILDSVRAAADQCGVTVATGDTKVVGRGQADGLFINTAGIGEKLPGFDLAPERVEAGDAVLVSGPVGDHGAAVLASRETIAVAAGPSSDTAPVHRLVGAIQPVAAQVRFMRDPTRGGLAAVLNEIVEDRPVGIAVSEGAVPLSAGTGAVCELLGLDPLHLPSEGRVVLVCAATLADEILRRWRGLPEGAGARRIGTVTPAPGRVVLETVVGGTRLVDVPRGELLPRIC